jgi:hypothetical protein
LRPWERKVEAGIHDLKPPVGDGVLLLGEDDDGLAAVVGVWLGESGALAKLAVVALAWRCQRSKLRLADEALEMALRAASDNGFSAGHHIVTAYGLIDPRNTASKAMCGRAGLRLIEVHDDGLEEWAIELELPSEFPPSTP